MALRMVWLSALAFAFLAVLAPLAAAHPAAPVQGGVLAGKVPLPVHGTVTSCLSNWNCNFSFSSSQGTGWAHGAGISYYQNGVFSFQLPGEAKASFNLTYSTYIALSTGTYTYWTVGNFVGTDVNTGHVVYGTTNTNYTITCHGHSGRGGGCNYTYTTDNGTVVVKFTNAQPTSTALSCSPLTTHPQGKVTCKVSVTNDWNASNVPTGKVKIADGLTGKLSDKGVCLLVNGACGFTYVPSDATCGSVVLSATYPGNASFYRSSASVTLSVVVSGGC